MILLDLDITSLKYSLSRCLKVSTVAAPRGAQLAGESVLVAIVDVVGGGFGRRRQQL
jgi:hypothetical protein